MRHVSFAHITCKIKYLVVSTGRSRCIVIMTKQQPNVKCKQAQIMYNIVNTNISNI